MTDEKAQLHKYLKSDREALLWKLDGLSEYDARRPMTPTGTNLLGLVKHVACCADGYFADTFGRPSGIPIPSFAPDAEPNADMWVPADETRHDIVTLWDKVWAHADANIEALDIHAVGQVPWWPADHNEVTLHRVLVHMVDETARHAGQADIVRELIDGAVGLRPSSSNMAPGDRQWWSAYCARVEQAARDAAG